VRGRQKKPTFLPTLRFVRQRHGDEIQVELSLDIGVRQGQRLRDRGGVLGKGVSGTVPLRERPALQALLSTVNGVRTIILDCADRLSRDATVALTGHQMLRDMGIELIASPQHFVDDTPTAKVIRCVLARVNRPGNPGDSGL
jgi:DNA invertase Pin-like site-specific DNA recombinase